MQKKLETVSERQERFSKIWSTSRANVGKTQEYMAKGLGISKKTVQNWESGFTSPDLFMGSEWFHVLGVNPLPYYLEFIFPNLFDQISSESDDFAVTQALIELIKSTTPSEKRELLYLMVGQHGSPWHSLLQLFTAHCHISMEARTHIARFVLDSYEMEDAIGTLVCPEQIKPDVEQLRSAVKSGKQAVIRGQSGYTNVRKPTTIPHY